jgi:hypothetical protein
MITDSVNRVNFNSSVGAFDITALNPNFLEQCAEPARQMFVEIENNCQKFREYRSSSGLSKCVKAFVIITIILFIVSFVLAVIFQTFFILILVAFLLSFIGIFCIAFCSILSERKRSKALENYGILIPQVIDKYNKAHFNPRGFHCSYNQDVHYLHHNKKHKKFPSLSVNIWIDIQRGSKTSTPGYQTSNYDLGAQGVGYNNFSNNNNASLNSYQQQVQGYRPQYPSTNYSPNTGLSGNYTGLNINPVNNLSGGASSADPYYNFNRNF